MPLVLLSVMDRICISRTLVFMIQILLKVWKVMMKEPFGMDKDIQIQKANSLHLMMVVTLGYSTKTGLL